MLRSMCFAAFAVGCLLGSSLPAADVQPRLSARQVRARLERLAGELPYLELKSVLFDRPNHIFMVAKAADFDVHSRALAEIGQLDCPSGSLRTLLDHPAPKVRTLALVALFGREDPAMLPALVKLKDDTAPTFDGHPELSTGWLERTGIGPPAREQTVRGIARAMLHFYLERAGYGHGVDPEDGPGFKDYWRLRGKRPYCASWFAVQLTRACQGTSPTPLERLPRVRSVRERVDALPPDDRALTLLWLRGQCTDEYDRDVFVSDEELIGACRAVGPEKLLLMLHGRTPTTDPDLLGDSSDLQMFVLQHAGALLRPQDAEEILECERGEAHRDDPLRTPWWAVAAAELQPDRASDVLHAALGRFRGDLDGDERSLLCIALARLAGDTEMPSATECFYADPSRPNWVIHARAAFLEALASLREPAARKLMASLVRDPRFDSLDWSSLERITRIVNGWSGTAVVPEDALRQAWHPFGYFDPARNEEAARRHPQETEQLNLHLERWRRLVRESLPQWLAD